MLRSPRLRIPKWAQRILRPLIHKAEELNSPLYVVGGCVRDWLLGAPTDDLDVAVEGDPAPLAALCAQELKAAAEAFGRFGTLRVLAKSGLRIDFAMARAERYPTPACLPEVSPAPIQQDLFRRDFTVNAMALRVSPGPMEIIDPYGGLKDLQAGLLRPLHAKSFRDDPTRVFRAARFLCRFNFKPATGFSALAKTALQEGHAGLLSRHRLMQELLCALGEKKPDCALRRLRSWGYLQLLHPSLGAIDFDLSSVEERLALLALRLGWAQAEKFLHSMPLEHAQAGRILETLKLARDKKSPRTAPSSLATRVLPIFFKRLPTAALKALYINGADLKKLGVPPGKQYHEILNLAARLQWRGKFSTRPQALEWLRAAVLRIGA